MSKYCLGSEIQGNQHCIDVINTQKASELEKYLWGRDYELLNITHNNFWKIMQNIPSTDNV